MCLAVPGKVLRVWDSDETRMATVDFGGIEKEVCLAFVPDLAVGEYTIVHVGFALQRLDEASALETLAVFASLGELDAEFGDQWQRAATQAGHEAPAASHEDAPAASHDTAPAASHQAAPAGRSAVSSGHPEQVDVEA